MARFGLVDTPPVPAGPAGEAASKMKLHMEEALASARRLWLRGQLLNLPPGTAGHSGGQTAWWARRRDVIVPAVAQPPPLLETRVGSRVLTAELQLETDGRFEATFTTELPVAKRGWRIARNRVTYLDQSAEKCTIITCTPEHARTAVIVLVPSLGDPNSPGTLLSVDRNRISDRIASALTKLKKPGSNDYVFYYLASTPGGTPRRADLALAMVTWGWPAGALVLVSPGVGQSARDLLLEGIDRLRWLFAGSLDVWIASKDEGSAEQLKNCLESKGDRASVTEYLNVDREPMVVARIGAPILQPPAPIVLRPTRAAHIPRHPVVFCHGMLAFTTLRMQLPEDLNCFSPLGDFLRQQGFRVLFPQVPPTSGVAVRAEQLREQIIRWTDEPVNIIAHSMGGLDARYMISHLDAAKRVRSLTTVATPHRGTYLVEWFLTNYRNRVPLLRAFEVAGISLDGFRDCRPDTCREFNASTPDMPDVKYFSYGGAVRASQVTPVLRRAWSILTAAEGPNDGMVSEASAHWGEYLGTVYADHFAQTPDMTFVRPGEDFDAPGFYCRVLEDLARRGF
jgi:triacylglycerol lipase